MAKHYETLTNKSGDVLAGHRVQVTDSSGAAVNIYADENSTPFTDADGNTVNYATSDAEGLAEFFWTPASGQVLQVLTPDGDLVKAVDRFSDALILSNLVGEVPQSQVTDLVADLAAKATTAALASTDPGKGAGMVAGAGRLISTRSAIAALTSDADKTRPLQLVEGLPALQGRMGTFVWVESNLSAGVTLDPDQGIYVPPASDTTGASGAWVRQFSGPVNAAWFGATGDGVTNDTAALQSALYFCGGVSDNDDVTGTITPKNNALFIPPGDYLTDTLYVPPGVRVLGAGGTSESSINTATRLIQNGAGDVLRFIAYTGSSLRYWWGEIADLAIWGDTSQTSGWAINFKTAADELVIPQDSNFLHRLTIRRCYEGGINLPSGAFPLTIADCKFLFNNGPGIKLTRATNFQGVHFLNISGDGNIGGLISLNTLNDGFASVLITNLKSEARANLDYGGTEAQLSPVVCTSCNDLRLVINGATHSSSIVDGANFKKPGDLVTCPSGGTPPRLSWNGVAILVRSGDTGTDPKIIGGAIVAPTVASAPYTVSSGFFNQTVRLFNARVAYSRATASDGDTTPTVEKHNCLLLNNTSATEITTFDDGIEGQEIFLVANNGNTTLKASGSMQLAGGVDYAMTGNDTCTLVLIGGNWREKCRSVN